MIDQLRAGIAALYAELAELANAGPSRTEVQRRVVAFAERTVAAGDQRLRYAVAADELGSVLESLNVSLLAALLGPEAFAAALCKHVDHVPKGTNEQQRTARATAIRLELDTLERAEEAEIVRIELQGTPIGRRATARPEIVLAIVDPDDAEPQGGHDTGTSSGPHLVRSAAMPEDVSLPRVARSKYLQRKDG